MELLNRLSIKLKIAGAFGIVLILLATVSWISYSAIQNSSSGFEEYREMAIDTNIASAVQTDLLMVRMAVKGYLNTATEKDLKSFQEYFEKVKAGIAQARNEIKKENRARILEEVEQEIASYNKYFSEVVTHTKARDAIMRERLNAWGPELQTKITEMLEYGNKVGDRVLSLNSANSRMLMIRARLYVVKFLDDNAKASSDEAFNDFDRFNAAFKKAMDAAPPTLTKVKTETYELSQKYRASFQEIVDAINTRNSIVTEQLDILGPKIAASLEEVKTDIRSVQDQIGPRLASQNENAVSAILVTSAVAIIAGIIISLFFAGYLTKVMAKISENLKEVGDNMSQIGDWITNGSDRMLQSTTEQAESLQETSASTTEISSMINSNTSATHQTSTLSQKCSQDAIKGKNSVESVKMAINQIHHNNEELVQGVNESNKEIEGIVGIIHEIIEKTKVINDIVFQTKLLAFNASVEAARAGEHGKGFSVVAEEVGSLAEMSGTAADEISALLEENAAKVEKIVSDSKSKISSVIEKGKVSVQEGITRSEECESILSEMQLSFNEVNDALDSIANASQEQSKGVEEISAAVAQLSTLTNESVIQAKDSSKKAQELKEFSGRLSEAVGEMYELAYGKKDDGVA